MASTTRRHLVISGSLFAAGVSHLSAFAKTGAPKSYGATPSARQLRWHKRKAYAFMHFTINTFTDREWGYGDESPSLFNPTDFDANQIVEAAKRGGLTGLILTAKHHDGFCLWPSQYTDHSIKSSPYRQGKGDIVGEMAEACRLQGLDFGIYLSPWDRNHPEYGRPAYVEYYHNQLRELTTQYGALFEVWFDGANGGDGFYGGARERRRIDGATYYQWDVVRSIVRNNQPNAVMFADANMDIRWVGNEEGVAGDPCWPTVDHTPYTQEKGNRGVRGGPIWNPAETNVSIRPGWFWHGDETPRSAANLTRIYFESIGRGTTLLLNLAPDRRGLIPEADITSLSSWNDIIKSGFSQNLADGATVKASSQFGRAFSPQFVLSKTKYWAAVEKDIAGAWLQLSLPKDVTFDVIQFSEDIRYGARVDDYAVEIWSNNGWQGIAHHTSIGAQRLIRLEAAVTTKKVRLRILSAKASPIINNFGLFKFPNVVEEPTISRDQMGMVTLGAHELHNEIHYTLDGSEPNESAPLYGEPFTFYDGGLIKAIARNKKSGINSLTTTKEFDVAPIGWKVTVDNSDFTEQFQKERPFFGHPSKPMEIVIDLNKAYKLKGFAIRPALQDISLDASTAAKIGAPAHYEAWVSNTSNDWGASIAKGEFSNIAASRVEQKIRFTTPINGRFLRIILPNAVQERPIITFGGLGIITR